MRKLSRRKIIVLTLFLVAFLAYFFLTGVLGLNDLVSAVVVISITCLILNGLFPSPEK